MSKEFVMRKLEFTTEMFRGRQGRINPLLDEFTTPEYFRHYHVTVHKGCTALPEWAERAIRESGKVVLYSDGDRETYLPEHEFPANENCAYTFIKNRLFKKNELFIRLDRLPARYEHASATGGGLGMSQEFIAPYNELKSELQKNLK